MTLLRWVGMYVNAVKAVEGGGPVSGGSNNESLKVDKHKGTGIKQAVQKLRLLCAWPG